MDKNAIKKFAVWARRELIERVSQKAMQYGITAEKSVDADADSVNGVLLSADEKEQRRALMDQVREKGYEEVMEEVAYTWFNRFSALRFMEVNGYLPSHVRVFTDEENHFQPQILTEAIHLDMDGLDMEKVFAYKDANKTEELYKYLIITQCNALNTILPGMFQKISDYTELLFPDNLLREGSVIQQMIALIPEEDWTNQVQILGWLYQYYNAEKKDEVFAALKKNVKIAKENIPAATQLFTPDWIVRYMVENSLGRLWIEHERGGCISNSTCGELQELKIEQLSARRIGPAPEKEIAEQFGWKYYLPEAEQEPEVEKQLAEIRKSYASMEPKDIKVIDPCCGSGHILAYMFDILMQIYDSYGYTTREAVSSILQNNLYGLDIDDRAAQLSYFSVMMKARQYDHRFFRHTEQPHVYAIQESNGVNRRHLDFMGGSMEELRRNNAKNQLTGLLDTLTDAKEYGSILNVDACDWELLRQFVSDNVSVNEQISMETNGIDETSENLHDLINLGEIMAQKYDVVVTNPPYRGVSDVGAKLQDFVKENYPNSKSNLFAVFVEKCSQMIASKRFQAMITQQTWMFTAIYEKLRENLKKMTLINLNQLGAKAFDDVKGEVVETATFVFNKVFLSQYKGNYCNLTEGNSEREKEKLYLLKKEKYEAVYTDFECVPHKSMAYWLSHNELKCFASKKIREYATTREGMTTANNDRFLRNWYEVCMSRIDLYADGIESAIKSGKKWFPYNKGGSNKKWFGNNELVVNWENNGAEIRNIRDPETGRIRSHNYNLEYSFRESGTWTAVCSGDIMVRYCPHGWLFDSKGASIFANTTDKLLYIIGMLNSKVSGIYLKVLSPLYEFKVGHVANVPLILKHEEEVIKIVQKCIKLAHVDWDSFEVSWDFQRHPLIKHADFTPQEIADDAKRYISDMGMIEYAYEKWRDICQHRFKALKSNEEELNRIFIDIYGLQEELTPEVEDKDITVYRVFDSKENIPESMGSSKYALTKQDVIKSFISYAVGCMFGRYSLDVEGLAYAGGEWDAGKYTTFPADEDNIIPICDDEYFQDDDIFDRFIKFVKTVYGEETLDKNLKFIADALGGRGQPREVIRKYFLNDFFKDHCKTYQKRPIYWLFDSGKKNGFKALIYMHRYQPDTIAKIRTDYVHEQQSRYRTAIADMENRIAAASSTSERVKLNKALAKLKDQETEIKDYEEKIHHLADQMISIDLDDGVKHNYNIFKDVLAKIK